MIISEKITGNEEIISEKDLINSVNSAKLAKFKEINQAKKQAKFVQSNTKIEKSDTQKLIERLVNDAVKNFLKKSETIETIDNASNQINSNKIGFKEYHAIRNEVKILNRIDLQYKRLGNLLERIPSNIEINYISNPYQKLQNCFIMPTLQGIWDITIIDSQALQISQTLGISIDVAAKFILCHELGHYIDFVAIGRDLIKWENNCQANPHDCEKRAFDYGRKILETFDECLLNNYDRFVNFYL